MVKSTTVVVVAAVHHSAVGVVHAVVLWSIRMAAVTIMDFEEHVGA